MKEQRNSILFTKTENIDGEIYTMDIYESEVRKKYGKDYFNMTSEEKKKCERYFN